MENGGEEGDSDRSVEYVDGQGGPSAGLNSCSQTPKPCAASFDDLNFGGEQEVQASISELAESHQEEKARLLESYVDCFPHWRFQLGNGFNLLFYGFGSKKVLLERFVSEALSDGPVIIVNGFSPTVSLKQILAAAVEAIWRCSVRNGWQDAPSSSSSSEEELLAFLAAPPEGGCVRLVVHSADAPALRHPEAQRMLAALAACSCIWMLASVDNVNSPLLWDRQVSVEQFNWWWHHTPTYARYVFESPSFRPSLAAGEEHRSARSALLVLKSLTPNAQAVFGVLARAQLAPKGSAGLPFHRWYALCRESFLVSGAPTLRSHQTEFRDHQLLRARKGKDGQDYLYITLPADALSKLLEAIGDGENQF